MKDSAIKDDLKLLQYADDMTLLLKHESDLKEALAEIDTFSKTSGLKLNKKKSLGMWVGSYKNKQYGSEEISWIKKDENIKILGVFFSTKAEASNIPENWTAKIEDIQLTVQRWSKRNRSLAGKVLIAKTFILSKLNYTIQALSLPKAIAAQIDSIIFKFLWQKKHSNKKAFEKIKRNNIYKEISDGGLGVISIVDKQIAFQIKWFKRGCMALVEDSAHGKIVSLTYLTRASVKSKEVEEVAAVQSDFWRS